MVNRVTQGGTDAAHREFALAEPKIRIAPSLLAADFGKLADDVERIEKAGAEVLHLDIMDGHFVPNISFGPGLIAGLRKRSKLYFDTHLMISDPAKYVEAFAKAGSDLITFHIEAIESPKEVIAEIRRLGLSVGVSINPGTEVSAIESVISDVDMVLVMSVWPGFGGQKFITDVLEKVRTLRGMLEPGQRLEIDGGIDLETVGAAVSAGADTLVAGTSVFRQDDPGVALHSLYKKAVAAIEERE